MREGEAVVTAMGESCFHLAEILVRCLSQGSSCYDHQERSDPLKKLKVERMKNPGRMPHLSYPLSIFLDCSF